MIAVPLLIFAVAWARPPTAALPATLVSLCVFLGIFRLVKFLQKPTKAEYQQYLHSRENSMISICKYTDFLRINQIFERVSLI